MWRRWSDSRRAAAGFFPDTENRTVTLLDRITSCRLNSDYQFTDPAQGVYRYQAVFDITYY